MNFTSDIKTAHDVLQIEARGIEALAESLDDNFSKAIDILLNLKGRAVITGIGKSGHVGHKIAATLASTGTPSFFVHPAEASHGDLGMITKYDVLLAISNSGESAELKEMVHYCKRFGIPLICIVSNKESTLAKSSDVVLLLPKQPEACPFGMAPTTSSTMTLALGDALAVTMMHRKGFTKEDYKQRHPGGKLGALLLKVGDIMHDKEELPVVHADDVMKEVLITMTAKSFGCVCVVDDNRELLGIITDGDLRRKMSENLLDLTAKDVMTENPKTTKPEKLAAEALLVMNEKKITSLFVLENKKPVGILHVHDCLRAGVA
jgi:arabinose-5-phosphate isomerase